ncbi:MAG: hypothetical protein IKX88_11460, partial [Thermoguttaceae bacterium]|nr:hypothetical protein [Thermoguttaceae bacterium]
DALVDLGSCEPSGDSSRRLSALRAGRVLVGDALRVIRAASGSVRSRADAAGKQSDALTLTNGFIGSYEPIWPPIRIGGFTRFARDALRLFESCCGI